MMRLAKALRAEGHGASGEVRDAPAFASLEQE
jgi:hypothetical protein